MAWTPAIACMWSGVETVQASMDFSILSNIFRKSWKVAAPGYFWPRDRRVLVSTSQSATILAPHRAELSVSLEPFPPAPIAARFILLLRFWPLSMNGPKAAALSAAVDEWEINLRRDSVLFGFFVIIFWWKLISSVGTFGAAEVGWSSPILVFMNRKKLIWKVLFKQDLIGNNCVNRNVAIFSYFIDCYNCF